MKQQKHTPMPQDEKDGDLTYLSHHQWCGAARRPSATVEPDECQAAASQGTFWRGRNPLRCDGCGAIYLRRLRRMTVNGRSLKLCRICRRKATEGGLT